MRKTLPRRQVEAAILLTAAVVIASIAGPACPSASAGGVHFDPTSPAGKEYALPLAQARNEAIGGGSEGESGAPAPLYGVGISSSPGGGGGGSGAGNASSGAGNGGNPGEDRGGTNLNRQDARNDRAGARLSPDDGGYPLIDFLLIVAAIVLLGAAVGVGLRLLAGAGGRRDGVTPA